MRRPGEERRPPSRVMVVAWPAATGTRPCAFCALCLLVCVYACVCLSLIRRLLPPWGVVSLPTNHTQCWGGQRHGGRSSEESLTP